MADPTLTATVRSSLLALQDTAFLTTRTQRRLSTGLAVSNAVDDPIKFFAAKTLLDRASDLASRKDAIDQGVNTLQTVTTAGGAIENLVKQMKGVVDSARSGTKAQRAEYNRQWLELITQVQNLVNDANYQGLNLLNSSASSLSVRFSDGDSSKIEVIGVDFNTSNLYLGSDGTASISVSAGVSNTTGVVSRFGFSNSLSAYSLSIAADLASFNTHANSAIAKLDATINNIRSKVQTVASKVSILQVRLEFTSAYVNTLKDGGDKLRLADLNEEGANLLALQTRQQLGIQALSFAGQAEQSILALFA